MSGDTEFRSRGPLALLRDRNFGPFIAGKILSSCGNWVQQIAASVLMFELTRSALLVGSVSMVLFAGPLVLALWTGVMTDRLDRRRLLMIGRVVSTVAAGGLAVLLLLRGTEEFGGPVVLLIGAGLMGFGHAVSVPAMQALTPGLVPDDDLEQALAFGSVAPSIARTVGPALGAGLLLLGGAGLAFAAAAATHVVFVVALALIRPRPQLRGTGRPRLLGGIRYVLRDRTSGLLLIGIALLGFGADPVMTLTPSLADDLGGSSELVGVFASAFGVGAIAAVMVFHRLRKSLSLRGVGLAGYVVVAIGLVVAALVHSIAWVTGGFLVAGAGFMLATVALNTRIQRRVPDELRGRVMALWGVAFLGSRTIAAPISGAVADATSVTLALFLAAAVVLLAALFARSRPHPTSEVDS